jgi:excisionase family DNA binding protein
MSEPISIEEALALFDWDDSGPIGEKETIDPEDSAHFGIKLCPAPGMGGERLVRVPELCSVLGVGRSTLYSRLKDGQLPAPRRWGGSLVWLQSEVDQFLAALPRADG